MLQNIEGRYGSKSGVVRQLNTLMQENDQMRKLASFNKFSNKGTRDNNAGARREEKNFLQQNKFDA